MQNNRSGFLKSYSLYIVLIIVVALFFSLQGKFFTASAASTPPPTGFVYVQGTRLMLNGQEFFSKGANWLGGRYIQTWPKISATEEMFTNMYYLDAAVFDPVAIGKELRETRELLGINTLRLPIYAPANPDGSFQNNSDERLLQLVRLAYQQGIRIHLVFFFGIPQFHCPQADGSLPLCDPQPWGTADIGNAVLMPPGSLEEMQTLAFVRNVTNLLKNEPGVLSYEVGNELLLNYVVRTIGYQEQVLSYIKRIINEIRTYDPYHLIASGEVTVLTGPQDNRWPWLENKGVEFVKFPDIHGLNNGTPFSLYDIVDYLAPHLYLEPSEIPGALDVLVQNSTKPIVIGEFSVNEGTHLAPAPLEAQKLLYQTVLNEAHTRLSGAWAWNPTPFLDLKPGTYHIDSWQDRAGNARPTIVLETTPERRIRTLSLKHWIFTYQDNVLNTFAPTPAASVFANRNYAWVSQSVPTTMTAENSYSVSVTVRNTGETVWDTTGITTPFGYVLGSQNPQDNKVWGIGRIALSHTPVLPSETVMINFVIQAPAIPGSYSFQWQMLQTGVEWFGEPTPVVMVQVSNAAPVSNSNTNNNSSPPPPAYNSNQNTNSSPPPPTTVPPEQPFFTDTNSHWANTFITIVHNRCGVTGFQDENGNLLHLFKPDSPISRAELVKLLIQCQGITSLPPSTNFSTFQDIVTGSWYAPFVLYAYEHGWIVGYPDGMFRSGQNVTRAEGVKLILVGANQSPNVAVLQKTDPFFQDVLLNDWFYPYVQRALRERYIDFGIFFHPHSPLTRAQAAKLIVLALGL